MHLVVSGDVVADVEFWLEDVAGDTLIHHLAVVHGPDRAATAAWRTLVRRGLWALADRLAAEVRRAVLVEWPPTEPGPTT